MILPDHELRAWAIHNVRPYSADLINPASIDLRLGGEFVDLHSNLRFFAEEIVIRPGMAILATTLEYIQMPLDCAGVVYLKSSLARMGLDHALAGWVDCGFSGELTMELHSHREIVLQHWQRVIQLVLYKCTSPPIAPYQGRYQGQTGPTEAR